MSKKVGNAVNRNRVKRVVREFVRTARCPDPQCPDPQWQRPWLAEDLDVVVIAKPQARLASTRALWADLRGHAAHLLEDSRAGRETSGQVQGPQ